MDRRHRHAFVTSFAALALLAFDFACDNELNLEPTSVRAFADAGSDFDASVRPPPAVDAGPPGRFYADQPGVVAMALDAENVYWAAGFADGGIYACPKTGCATDPLLLPHRQSPRSLGVFAGRLYWTETDSDSVHWCNVASCRPNEPPLPARLGPNGRIAVDESGVYVIAGRDLDLGFTRCSFDGQCASLSGGLPVSDGGAPTELAIGAAGDVFMTSFGAGSVRRYRSGILEDVVSDRRPGRSNLTATPDGEWIYFTNKLTGDIARAPAKGTMLPSQLVVNDRTLQLIALDRENVYWTNETQLQTCPSERCDPVTLIFGVSIGALAVDPSGVWFSSLDTSSIHHIGPY